MYFIIFCEFLSNAFKFEVYVKDLSIWMRLVENAKWGQSFSNSSFVFTFAFMSLTYLILINSFQLFPNKTLVVF